MQSHLLLRILLTNYAWCYIITFFYSTRGSFYQTSTVWIRILTTAIFHMLFFFFLSVKLTEEICQKIKLKLFLFQLQPIAGFFSIILQNSHHVSVKDIFVKIYMCINNGTIKRHFYFALYIVLILGQFHPHPTMIIFFNTSYYSLFAKTVCEKFGN